MGVLRRGGKGMISGCTEGRSQRYGQWVGSLGTRLWSVCVLRGGAAVFKH